MEPFQFYFILVLGALFAGFIGALTGLGGGIVIVPLLTLGLGIPMKYAIAVSLISVIGTSSGAAAAFVKEGITNMRVGMFLQVPTAIGAVIGALIVLLWKLPVDIIGIIFGVVLLITALLNINKKPDHRYPLVKGSQAERLKLYGSFMQNGHEESYSSKNVYGGAGIMCLAGILSGLLGVGGGVFKVLAMDNVMRLPFKVSTTTSNFMIGVTAASSGFIYFAGGYVKPELAGPVVLGVLLGAMLGSKLLMKINVGLLKKIFALIVTVLALYMIYNGWMGSFSAKQG